MSSTGDGPELVIGLIGAVGCDLRLVSGKLVAALREVSYDAVEIHASHLLWDLDRYRHLRLIHDRETQIEEHMNAGDWLRSETSCDAMALLSVVQLKIDRQLDAATTLDTDSAESPRPRTAYIINSLKRPEEVAKLRSIYGGAFVALSAYASRQRRRDDLATRIARSRNEETRDCYWRAEKLMDRDENGRDERGADETGQNVRDTFPLADAFINAETPSSIEQSVRRIVSILFAHPFETPTIDEMAMQFAFSAALRSADLSRQVGYAACTQDGQVLAVGTNEVAKAGGGLYWPGVDDDGRDFRIVEVDEPNAEMKRAILKDLLERLSDQKALAGSPVVDDAYVSDVYEKLKGSRFSAITEYGRAVHAEMGVITDAARRGVSLQGSTFYGTTFPCHNCAKHIVASGVKRLVYIEPYPKSQVERLFRDSITLESSTDGRVFFQPFVGVAPTRFVEFFTLPDRRDGNGRIITWAEVKATAEPRVRSDPSAYIEKEHIAIQEFGKALEAAGVQFAESEDENQ